MSRVLPTTRGIFAADRGLASLAVLHQDVGAYRYRVDAKHLSLVILDQDCG